MSKLLRDARLARSWSSSDLRRELRRAGEALSLAVPSDASLRVQISRWENGHSIPDAPNRLLLEEAFGMTSDELGIPSEPDCGTPNMTALLARAGREAVPSTEVLSYFERQLAEHARFDNLAGPQLVLPTATGQLQQVELLVTRGGRETAQLAARYSEFTGWLHQDVGDDQRALRLTERAIDLAELAGEAELATYNTMRKANVLLSAGQLHLAAATAQRALGEASTRHPRLVPICLRQSALASARLRDESASREAIERAMSLTHRSVDDSDVLSPYCTTSYLQMEEAMCLLALRRPAQAADSCARALIDWPAELARDKALCLARRGVALAELRAVDEACHAALAAIDGVRSAPSGRALHMLRLIVTRLRPLGRNANVRELADALAEVA